MAALSLAESCAKWIARFRGGKPEDYFTLDNVAVIHPTMLRDLVKRMQSHNIYILDDAGAAYDARNYMKQDNKALGYVLQTFRTLNSILIVTGVDGAMLDVNLHRTARYYAEVSESRHDLGYTDVKVFRALRKYRQKTVHYRYLTQNRTQIIRYRAYLPSKDLIEPYEVLRKEQALLIQTMEDQAEQKKKKKPKNQEGIYLTCQFCGYKWYYKGKNQKATCPGCWHKVPISGDPSATTPLKNPPPRGSSVPA
jgi:DNA-directed RNA polymerase subunit RPC12/RpoP